MNLVIALLHTRSSLTAEQIRTAVTQYGDAGGTADDEAFKRMFERDKAELRELGIPLETVEAAEGGDAYRIARRDYELPPIELAPDEAAAIQLAARAWRTAALSSAAARAVRKLSAAGEIVPDDAVAARLEPRVDAAEPCFEPLLDAVRARRAVRFSYRPADRPQATERTVEPWGLVCWHGRWYVVGHDRDRDATRVFRLGRIAGDVRAAAGGVRPSGGIDLADVVGGIASRDPAGGRVRLKVRRDRGADLRAQETSVQPAGDDGWDVVEVADPGAERLADRVAGYGADVVVLDPPEARAALRAHWDALLDSQPSDGRSGPLTRGAEAMRVDEP